MSASVSSEIRACRAMCAVVVLLTVPLLNSSIAMSRLIDPSRLIGLPSTIVQSGSSVRHGMARASNSRGMTLPFGSKSASDTIVNSSRPIGRSNEDEMAVSSDDFPPPLDRLGARILVPMSSSDESSDEWWSSRGSCCISSSLEPSASLDDQR